MIRVLITDDHPLWRERVRELLEKENDILVVGEAEDGEQAVEMCEDLSPDVVLMDVRMPHLDGLQATERLHSRMPNVRVLLFSISRDPWVADQALAMGAKAYWSKESDPLELVSMIQAIGTTDGGPSSIPTPSRDEDMALL